MAYGIREIRPTAHAVIPAAMVILAPDRALTPSSIDAPAVIRSSIKKQFPEEFHRNYLQSCLWYFGFLPTGYLSVETKSSGARAIGNDCTELP